MTPVRIRTKVYAAASALAAGTLLVLVPMATATAAPATSSVQAASTEIHIKQASIADHRGDCANGATGAHIILNQISSPPETIEASFSDGSTATVALSKYVGKTAHYDAVLPAGTTLRGRHRSGSQRLPRPVRAVPLRMRHHHHHHQHHHHHHHHQHDAADQLTPHRPPTSDRRRDTAPQGQPARGAVSCPAVTRPAATR